MKIYAYICLVGVFSLASNCNNEKKLNEPAEEQICLISQDAGNFLNKDIKIRGRLIGFHHLLIYSEKCPEPRFSLFVSTSPELRRTIVEELEKLDDKSLNDGNFHFSATILGTLQRINHSSSDKDCFVPAGVISNDVQYCISASSIENIALVHEN